MSLLFLFMFYFTIIRGSVTENRSDNYLMSVPNDLNRKATMVILRNNQISNIPGGIFIGLNAVHQLYLSSNIISIVENTSFMGLTTLRELYLNDNKLQILPELSYMNMTLLILDLSNNDISELQYTKLQHLFKLQQLFLSGNHVRYVGQFPYMPHLYILTLNDNNISLCHQYTFNNLPSLMNINIASNKLFGMPDISHLSMSLTTLTFTANKLTSINESMFKDFDKLTNLYLNVNELSATLSLPPLISLHYIFIDKNKIEHIDMTAFKSTNNLITFNALHNNIRNFPDFSILDNKTLVTLNLRWNKISSFDPNSLKGYNNLSCITLAFNTIRGIITLPYLPSLTYLGLDGNAITDIVLDTLPKIQHLSLARNMLTALPNLTAIGKSLKLVNFYKNNINFIEALHLQRMTELTILRLGRNPLVMIPNVILDIPGPLNIYLKEVPLHCDISLCWFSRTVHNITLVNAKCSSPPEVTTLDLNVEMMNAYFHCNGITQFNICYLFRYMYLSLYTNYPFLRINILISFTHMCHLFELCR